MFHCKIVSLLIMAMTATSWPAYAQYQPLINPLVRTTIPQVIQCPGCNKEREKDADDARAGDTAAATVAASASTLAFIPDLEARKRNLAGFVARMRAQSPANTEQMAQFFASTDIFVAM
jgi:hypothetical protein